ncbi:MAG: sigma 54-interacting transcriptional regulator [Desulfovibrio sp.]|jgi:PAS domain S-box-containing protein|nr:sigma 54-interacting transcriptional regulator [Desulfovibrio sp.]
MRPDIEPFTFAVIAPYGNLAGLAKKVAADMPCTLVVRDQVALEEAADAAQELVASHVPDVILSRGGTAAYIRKRVETPVVGISTTALDLLRTLFPFAGQIRHVAFFNYLEPMIGVDLVGQTLGITIDEYFFYGQDDLFACMLRAKMQGAELGIGGVLTARMHEICGVRGIVLEAGEDAVARALREAISIAEVNRVAQQRQARLYTILDTIAEGMLVTDETNTITLINTMAERLLGVSAEQALGRKGQDVIPNTRTLRVLQSGIAEINEIQDAGKFTIVTSRVPIIAENRPVGVVCTFSEAGNIRIAERRLRGRRQNSGFCAHYRLSDILTRDPAMERLKNLAQLYADTDANIVLQGESGSGKELFAQGIHLAGRRGKGPFVAVNCAAIPETLLESELFGHEEGAFTGARRQGKAGFFELAHNGTLFLDEVSELPRSLQSRLLRVLQEREIIRVGGVQVIPVDIRIICATNLELSEQIADGLFREDLYYRLNVLSLTIPPLRDRPQDIPLLARAFLHPAFSGSKGEEAALAELTPRLLSHAWPGNVRELANVMERLVIAVSVMPDRPWIELLDEVWAAGRSRPTVKTTGNVESSLTVPLAGSLKEMTQRLEREAIRTLLADSGNDQAGVAKTLGISRMSLWRKLRQDREE